MQLTEMILTEGADFSEDGLIKGVVICGRTSKNGREYSEACLKDALPLYEGKSVYLNHKSGERDVESRFGRIENARMEDGKSKGDLRYLLSHPVAVRVKEDLQRGLGFFGLSHHVDAKGHKKDGKTVVEQITRVKSIDLVTDPGTTLSLTEQEQEPMDKIQEALAALLATEGLTKEQFLAGCEEAWTANMPAEPAPAPAVTEQELKEQLATLSAEVAKMKTAKYIKPKSETATVTITEQTVPADTKGMGKWLRSK